MSTGHGTTMSPDTGAITDERGWTLHLGLSLFCIAMVMEIVSLSYAKVSIALPLITRQLHTTQGGWLLTSSLLVGAVASPLLGRLADLHGKRRMLLIALAVSWVGSVLAMLAPDYALLIAGRALQGTLISCLFLSYSLIRDVYPPRTVPLAVSVCTGGLGLASIVTPFLNGWLLDTWGWRAIFAFDVAWIAVLGAAIVATTPETPLRRKARVDLMGATLLGIGAAVLLFGVSFGPTWGWGSAATLLTIALGLVMLVAWVATAQRVREPLVDISVISRRPILLAAVTSGLIYGGTVFTSTMLPLMSLLPRAAGLGYGLGLSPLGFAVIGSPNAGMIVVGGIVVGLTVRRLGGRALMVAGLAIVVIGALFTAYRHDSVTDMVIGAVIMGFGAGLGYGAVPNLVIAATPARDQGAVASFVQICQTGLSAVMPVVLFTILASNIGGVVAGTPVYTLAGFRYGWFVLAGLSLVGALLAVTVLKPRRPA